MIGYQCVRAPFWQWTILSQRAQCFNNPPPTYERSLPLPSRAAWGPFWILLFSTLLNPFALSWHPFICIALCLVLPLCLVPLRMLYLVCGSLSSLLSHQPWMLLLFPSWLHVWKAGSLLTPGLALVPRSQDSICLLLSPSVLDDSGRQTGQFGKMNTPALSTSLVVISGFSSPSQGCAEKFQNLRAEFLRFHCWWRVSNSTRIGGPSSARLNIQRLSSVFFAPTLFLS